MKGDIAIVGAGFSGSLLALQILRADPEVRVHLIEKAEQFGRGLAYGAADPEHLLNVRAANMSALPEEPSHFLDWLRLTNPGQDEIPTFVSRHLYGTYLQALLGTILQTSHGAGRLVTVADEAIEVHLDGSRPQLRLALGHDLAADHVVLATGNLPPHDLPCFSGADPSIYASDPWAADAFADLDPASDVLLVGTGLTAVDMILRLRSRGHVGSIRALSRRGLRPHRHESDTPAMAPWPVPPRPSWSVLLRSLREATKATAWREVIDGVRPDVQRLWCEASPEERRRFLRHLRPWWDIHRHRIAPDVAQVVEELEASGQLTFLAGRIGQARFEKSLAIVAWSPRGADQTREMQVHRIVNCTGPAGDIAKSRSPLLRDLLARGHARPDACGLGLDVDQDCRLIDNAGVPQDCLLAIGPLSRGAFWEITAVPDIRVQAAQTACRVTRYR